MPFKDTPMPLVFKRTNCGDTNKACQFTKERVCEIALADGKV